LCSIVAFKLLLLLLLLLVLLMMMMLRPPFWQQYMSVVYLRTRERSELTRRMHRQLDSKKRMYYKVKNARKT